jgi:hypothetical protein
MHYSRVANQIGRGEKGVDPYSNMLDGLYYGYEGSPNVGLDTPTRNILDFVLESFGFKQQIREFSEIADQYNNELYVWQRTGKPSNDLEQSILRKREWLKDKNKRISEKIESIRGMLKNCVTEASLP